MIWLNFSPWDVISWKVCLAQKLVCFCLLFFAGFCEICWGKIGLSCWIALYTFCRYLSGESLVYALLFFVSLTITVFSKKSVLVLFPFIPIWIFKHCMALTNIEIIKIWWIMLNHFIFQALFASELIGKRPLSFQVAEIKVRHFWCFPCTGMHANTWKLTDFWFWTLSKRPKKQILNVYTICICLMSTCYIAKQSAIIMLEVFFPAHLHSRHVLTMFSEDCFGWTKCC